MCQTLNNQLTNGTRKNQETVLGVRDETVCRRCGGLLVSEFCMDVLDGLKKPDFVAHRCVQCGEVVDPVIMRNRRLRKAYVAAAPGTNCGICHHSLGLMQKVAGVLSNECVCDFLFLAGDGQWVAA